MVIAPGSAPDVPVAERTGTWSKRVDDARRAADGRGNGSAGRCRRLVARRWPDLVARGPRVCSALLRPRGRRVRSRSGRGDGGHANTRHRALRSRAGLGQVFAAGSGRPRERIGRSPGSRRPTAARARATDLWWAADVVASRTVESGSSTSRGRHRQRFRTNARHARDRRGTSRRSHGWRTSGTNSA